MSEYLIERKYLLTEGDVEQKVVLPLLMNPEPQGLGFDNTQIQNKLSLKKLTINKRSNSKLYYPDFLILMEGLPFIVIEVKKPDEDLEEAFREARLYALEANALYKSELNPCKLIIATDGLTLFAGTWDDNEPKFKIEVSDWLSTNINFSAFSESFGLRKITKDSSLLRKEMRTNVTYKKPTHMLGGKHIQNQQIKNSFGESISIQYRHLFNPTVEAERTDVVVNAYVQVQKHQSHVSPIDRLIRKKIRPSVQDTTEILDNISPQEIVDKLKVARNYNNQVLLLVGSVGSGKSTFTTYLKEVALDQAIKSRISWVRLDLNEAPVNSQEIYKWLKKEICETLKTENSDFETHSLESIKMIYSKEISEFNKVALALFNENSDSYKEKLFSKITELQSDQDVTLSAFIRHFVHNQNKELIIVLDNCDKRNLEEQLLMFEVANWLKENTKSIVFLPLRETTFDHHRHQKPLDTVVKDLIFRINPPSLEKVIYNRVKYAKRLSEKSENHFYYLPNGIKVNYPSKDELSYLKSILKSLFQNPFFKKLLTGIAGRDIRKGIEVFLDFCKSGHISESEIFQMKQSEGNFELPNHIISRVFIRGNRLYYSDSETKVKNLFYSDPSDQLPDPFARPAILNWLKENNRKKGPSGIIGFHQVSQVIKELNILGHSIDRLKNEILNLIESTLIISESQDSTKIDDEELISINAPGLVHLDLLNNIDYLSSCAEDVWYRDQTLAEKVTQRIAGKTNYSHFSLQTSIYNSEDLLTYLEVYCNNFYSVQQDLLSSGIYTPPLEFERMKRSIYNFKSSIGISDQRNFESGTEVEAKVVNVFDYGLICELNGSSQVGLLHVSEIDEDDLKFDIGDKITVIVVEYQTKHHKYKLKMKKK